MIVLLLFKCRKICSRARLASEWLEYVLESRMKKIDLKSNSKLWLFRYFSSKEKQIEDIRLFRFTNDKNHMFINFFLSLNILPSVRCLFCSYFSHDVYDVTKWKLFFRTFFRFEYFNWYLPFFRWEFLQILILKT